MLEGYRSGLTSWWRTTGVPIGYFWFQSSTIWFSVSFILFVLKDSFKVAEHFGITSEQNAYNETVVALGKLAYLASRRGWARQEGCIFYITPAGQEATTKYAK